MSETSISASNECFSQICRLLSRVQEKGIGVNGIICKIQDYGGAKFLDGVEFANSVMTKTKSK